MSQRKRRHVLMRLVLDEGTLRSLEHAGHNEKKAENLVCTIVMWYPSPSQIMCVCGNDLPLQDPCFKSG